MHMLNAQPCERANQTLAAALELSAQQDHFGLGLPQLVCDEGAGGDDDDIVPHSQQPGQLSIGAATFDQYRLTMPNLFGRSLGNLLLDLGIGPLALMRSYNFV